MKPISRELWEEFTIKAAQFGAASGESEVINAYYVNIGKIMFIADSRAEVASIIQSISERLEIGDDMHVHIQKNR
jgi:hypothetical protein